MSCAGCGQAGTAWSGLTVTQIQTDGETQLLFKDGSRVLLHFGGLRPLSKTGTLKAGGRELFYAAGYSGGESGCCENLHVFYRSGDTVQAETLERSSYGGAMEVVDLEKADGEAEITAVSEEFYGASLKGCSAFPGIHEGMSEIHVPEFFKPIVDGTLRLENVTASEAYRTALTARLDALAPKIKALAADLKPDADAAALLQIISLRKKAGLPADKSLERFTIDCAGKKRPLVSLLK